MPGTKTQAVLLFGWPYWISSAAALIAGVASALTLFAPGVLRGTAAMNGSGRGTASVVLFVAVPLLVISMVLVGRGAVRPAITWLGATAYVLYNSVLFLFITPFNQLFLLYVAMFSLSFWSLVTVLRAMDVPTFAQRYSAKFLARPIAAVLTVIAVLNGLAWLANVVPAVFNTSMPAFLAGTGLTTNPVYVQDLSFWIPLMLVSSVWLWHRRPWGFVNAGALLVFGFIESISIAVDQWMGSVADPSSPVSSASLTPIFGGVAAAMLIPLFLYFRDLGPAVNGKAIARGALVLVDGFAAISALFGGLELETGWPSRFPTTMLQGTPFSDFVVPGLILGLMVGGTATIATVETVRSVSGGAAWSFMAGCIMAGWITGEVLLLDILGNTGHGVSAYFWLQPFYFGVGVVMVVLAVILAPDGWRGIARTTHMTRLSNWR